MCQILDYSQVEISLKAPLVKALVRLSQKSGRFPDCLILNEVKVVGDHAIARGAFGDIWLGSIDRQEVAIKALRMFRESDSQGLLKVSSSSSKW
jgi:hypothetical protein